MNNLTLNTDGIICHIRVLFEEECFCGIKRKSLQRANVFYDLSKPNICEKCKAEYVKRKLLGELEEF